jgi:glucokinase
MGGTKMLAVVLDDHLQPIGRAKRKTPAGGDHDLLLGAIVTTIQEAAADAGIPVEAIRAIGVAVPGPLNREEGRVIDTVNVGMRDYPLRDKLQDALGVRVDLENDVNAGTYGEFIAGAASGYRNVVGVFPGTGVGGGIVIDGKLYRGRLGRAGEIGHMIVQAGGPLCGCGHHGCLEAVSSKTAIAKDLVHLASVGLAPVILQKAGTEFKSIKSALIKKSINAGEEAVIEVVDRAAWYLGVGLANCVNIFDPDVLVIGGGLVEKLGDDYLEKVRRSTIENSMVPTDIPIVAATLGDGSVVVGAASLAAQEVDNG